MRDKESAILQMVGLATKAGKTVTGYDVCKTNIKSEKAHLVLIATDASDQTKRTITTLCEHHEIRYDVIADKYRLGVFTGKDNRAFTVITDKNLAQAMINIIDQ